VDFRIEGLVDKPVRFTWEEIHRMPQTKFSGHALRDALEPLTSVLRECCSPKGCKLDAKPLAGSGRSALRHGARRKRNTANLRRELMKRRRFFLKHDGERSRRTWLSGAPDVPHLYLGRA